MLYKVRVGQDVYIGTPDEVVAFMMRAEGAPGGADREAYMQATAARVAERLGVQGILTSDATAFLDSLGRQGVLAVETAEEPSHDRVDPKQALGDGPIAYGPGVSPDDVEL